MVYVPRKTAAPPPIVLDDELISQIKTIATGYIQTEATPEAAYAKLLKTFHMLPEKVIIEALTPKVLPPIPARPILHEGQIDIKSHAKRFNVINCGRRFGKDILCIDLAIDILEKGGKCGWYQPTYKSLMEVWRACKRILAPIIPKNGINVLDKRIEVTTGGLIEFWSLDGDPEASRGRDYDRVIINEAAKARQLQTAWDLAIRPTLMDRRGDAWFPSTPRGRDYYFDLFQRGQVGSLDYDPNWVSWQKPTHDNPHIPKEELVDAEKSMPVTVYRQEILAEFLDVAGRFFDEWEPAQWVTFIDASGKISQREEAWHVVEPFPIPDHWQVWASVDPGTSKHARTHAVLFFASDPEGGVVIFDEIYEKGKQSAEQAELLLLKLETYKRACPVDPARRNGLWRLNTGPIPCDYANFFPPPISHTSNAVSLASAERIGKWPVEYYHERGIRAVRAVKDRIAGWREMKQWLHDTLPIKPDSARLSKVDGEDSRPKLRVFRGRCANLIRTIPLMIRDERKPEDIEEDTLGVGDNAGHLEQHLVDCCFIAGTLISTSLGDRPIEDIKYGDMVWTRKGLRRVIACGPTTPRVVGKLMIESAEIVGTLDHPVWVDGQGFTALGAIRYNDKVVTVNPKELGKCQRYKSSKVSHTAATRSQSKSAIAGISSVIRTVCIGLYGDRLMGKSLKDIMSTIKTKTTRITRWITLNACRPTNTESDIRTRAVVTLFGAISAVKSSAPILGMTEIDFALTGASQLGAGLVGLTMSNAYAHAGKPLLSTATRTLFTALGSALGRVATNVLKSLRLAGNAGRFLLHAVRRPFTALRPVVSDGIEIIGVRTVYNLTVEGCPEYFANGVLVHNCRYGLMSRPGVSPDEPEAEMTPQEVYVSTNQARDDAALDYRNARMGLKRDGFHEDGSVKWVASKRIKPKSRRPMGV